MPEFSILKEKRQVGSHVIINKVAYADSFSSWRPPCPWLSRPVLCGRMSIKCLVNHRPEEWETQLLTFGFVDAMNSSNLSVFEIKDSPWSSIWKTHAPLLCKRIVFETSQIRVMQEWNVPPWTFYLLSCYHFEPTLLVPGISEATMFVFIVLLWRQLAGTGLFSKELDSQPISNCAGIN